MGTWPTLPNTRIWTISLQSQTAIKPPFEYIRSVYGTQSSPTGNLLGDRKSPLLYRESVEYGLRSGFNPVCPGNRITIQGTLPIDTVIRYVISLCCKDDIFTCNASG